MKLNFFDIPVEVTRKRVKNLHLYVIPPDGSVKLTVPMSLSENDIEKFLFEKREWIKKKRELIISRHAFENNEYNQGDRAMLFGSAYPIVISRGEKKAKAEFDGSNIIIFAKENASAEEKEAAVKELYRSLLYKKLEKHVPLWESITDLHCNEWRIKSMKTRWGTCNISDGRIWFSLSLAKKNISFIDYVILHELCHLKVKNHGDSFKALLSKYMPDWQKRKSGLNGNH